MQQACMVRIPDVLVIKLPVSPDPLPRITQYPDWPIEYPVQPRPHDRTKIILQRFHLFGEGNEDQAVIGGDPELAQRMLRRVKVEWVTALAVDTLAEGHADQVALQVVAPLMINAQMACTVATQFPTHQRTPMGAAVDERVQPAILAAVDDDRGLAHEGGLKSPGLRTSASSAT